ncbi:helix-turn-helix transcriptional regulator [Variovorax fucosicus]|uniref:helix-turn-helix transcriptional regulator n=1 Tax=Variovorax fucosicus TaxID=3053517 RepID=UPI002576CBB0|nr:AlpA family phage regulatory protein [Variovorax sp. J22G47]MDM0057689.1 AlpA family phage regulatory protein [Variovorax sp. J22G47]
MWFGSALLAERQVYRRTAQGTFPPQVRIGPRAFAWFSDDLQTWINGPAATRASRLLLRALRVAWLAARPAAPWLFRAGGGSASPPE